MKELIQNEKTRMATYRRRKLNLLKKAYELTTLCGIEAGMIIYGPRLDGQPVKPETWVTEGSNLTDIIIKSKESNNHQRPNCNFPVRTNLPENNTKRKRDVTWTVKIDWDKYTTWDERLDSLMEEQLKVVLGRMDGKLQEAMNKLNKMRITKGDDRTAVKRRQLATFNHQTTLNSRPIGIYDHQTARIFDGLQPMNSGFVNGNGRSTGFYNDETSSSRCNVTSLQRPAYYRHPYDNHHGMMMMAPWIPAQNQVMITNPSLLTGCYIQNMQPMTSQLQPAFMPNPTQFSFTSEATSNADDDNNGQAKEFHNYFLLGSRGNQNGRN